MITSIQNQLHYTRGYTSILILRKHYSPNQSFGDSICESKDGTPRLIRNKGLKSTKANRQKQKEMSKRKKRDEERNVENSGGVSTKHRWAKNSTKHKTECNVRIIMRGAARSRNNVALLFIYTNSIFLPDEICRATKALDSEIRKTRGNLVGSSTYVNLKLP